MGEFTDKVSAAANNAVGKTKEAIGDATDNEKLKAEGEAQQLKGTAQDVRAASRARSATTSDQVGRRRRPFLALRERRT